MDWFWPIKTGRTFVDVWTIFHLAFWVFMGSNFWALRAVLGEPWKPRAMVVGIVASLLWEVFEKYAERRWPEIWLTPESWLNSWVSDPLTCVIGMLFAWYALDHWRL